MKATPANSKRDRAHGALSTPGQGSSLSQRELVCWSLLFGLLNIVLHFPFLFHYALYFQSQNAICFLLPKRMLLGEFYVYQWGSDYGGIGPGDFLTALLFKLFGASIPVAGFISLLYWGAGVGLLAGYFGLCFGKRALIGSGCALTIGMPFFLKYSTQPFGTDYNTTAFFVGAFLWLAVWNLRKGPTSWLTVLTALFMGWFWYAHKHVLVIWASIGLAMLAVPEGRAFLMRFLRSKMALLSLIAFLVGYSPEILYKMGAIDNAKERQHGVLLGLEPPEKIAGNWYMMLRCLGTYFDFDPWGRAPVDVDYLNHMENWESFPLSAVDTVGVIAAFIVIAYILRMMIRSYRRRDFQVLALSGCVFVDGALILVSARSDASYYSIQRYLLPAGFVALGWLGVRLAKDLQAGKWLRAAPLALLLGLSTVHQEQLLQVPDSLANYREITRHIAAKGYKYGISWYHYSHLLTSLSNEKVQFAILDYSFQSPYQKPALEADTVAVVWPAKNAPPFEFAQQLLLGGVRFKDDAIRQLPDSITILSNQYTRVGEPDIVGDLAWAPYHKAGPVFNLFGTH